MKQHSTGFTLVEILVAVAIFGVIISLGLLMSMETLRGTTFRSERDTMVAVLQKARSRAMANINQSPWGVHYQMSDHTYTIFRGSAFAAGAPTNEVVQGNKDASTTPSLYNVVFTQLSGTTNPLSVIVEENSRNTTLSVNYEGTIIW